MYLNKGQRNIFKTLGITNSPLGKEKELSYNNYFTRVDITQLPHCV